MLDLGLKLLQVISVIFMTLKIALKSLRISVPAVRWPTIIPFDGLVDNNLI